MPANEKIDHWVPDWVLDGLFFVARGLEVKDAPGTAAGQTILKTGEWQKSGSRDTTKVCNQNKVSGPQQAELSALFLMTTSERTS